VFASLINFLLVPLYTRFLRPVDYGDLALLLLFGTMAKIVFRLGLDAGFFRIHYDLPTERERKALAGTIVVFSAISGGALLGLVAALARPLTNVLLGTAAPAHWVIVVAADVYLGAFAFVPLSLLRIQDRPGVFSTFSAGRHALNTALKVFLIMRGLGVSGVVWSDLAATGAFALALLPGLRRHAVLAFSPRLLREALGFGLPKVPHGILVQVQNLADRKILDLFVARAEVGIYQLGYTFGTAVKFPLSAFEPAWQPFVYAQVHEPDAPATLARVVRFAFAGFAAVGLAVAVLGPELLVLMTPKAAGYRAAAPVIPVVALAYVLHGVFLLTSIGIGISKRARYYPMVTAAAAATNVAASLVLIPRLGMMGAAWATVLSYAVMAALGYALSQRLYPLPLEWRRLGRAVAAAMAVYLGSRLAPAALWPAVGFKVGLLAAFPVLLALVGFLRPAEWQVVRRLALQRATVSSPPTAGAGV
jgi:O-antigen/teichoic acid export membrane protein